MKKNLITFLLCIGIALALPGGALAQKVGSLTVVQGTVDLIPAGKAAHEAKKGEPVEVGDSIRTRKEGRAEITFDDGTIVRVARSTEMEINKFLIGDKQTDAQINLPRGKIQSMVPKKVGQLFGQKEANRYEVKTPVATCGVRGTDFFTYHQDGMSGATFKEGKGYLYNNSKPEQVSMIVAGQTGTITDTNPPVVRKATPKEMQDHEKDMSSKGGEKDDTILAYTPPPVEDEGPPIDIRWVDPNPPIPLPPPPPPPPPPTNPLVGWLFPADSWDSGPASSLYTFVDGGYIGPWGLAAGEITTSGTLDDGAEITATYTGGYALDLEASGSFPALWLNEIYAYTNPTKDWVEGFIGGLWRQDNAIEGRAVGLYIDNTPNGKGMGFLVGDLTGLYGAAALAQLNGDALSKGTDDLGGIFTASGTLQYVQIVSEADMPTEYYEDTKTISDVNIYDGYIFDSDLNVVDYYFEGYAPSFNEGAVTAWVKGVGWSDTKGPHYLGTFSTITGNQFETAPDINSVSALAYAHIEEARDENGHRSFSAETVTSINHFTYDNETQSGTMHGTVAGAWVDIDKAMTGVLGGQVKGIFNPDAWQAQALGVLMDTKTFLTLTETAAGRDKLEALSIPNVEFGRANLSGSSDSFANMHINNLIFLSSRDNPNSPTIWASGEVGGTIRDGVNPVGQSILLSGLSEQITANVTMDTWENNKFTASVTNGEATHLLKNKVDTQLQNTIAFEGKAAGTTSGNDFSGTASGIVKPYVD